MKRARRRRRKRCPGCQELFHPDPRVGRRQEYCAKKTCQRIRKRNYQRRFRAEHPSEERGRRLREALAQASSSPSRPQARPRDPLALIPWDEVESELGTPTSVVLVCILGVVMRSLARSRAARRVPLSDGPARSADGCLSDCPETENDSTKASASHVVQSEAQVVVHKERSPNLGGDDAA